MRRWTIGASCIGLFVLTWVAFFEAGLVALAVWIPVVVVSLVFARRLTKLLVLASPFMLVPILGFLLGTISYFNGTASFMTMGFPGEEFENLDPESRIYWSTGGCVVNDSEPFWQGPNNAAVEILASWFGPMRGAYVGPYPTRDEAWSAVDGDTVATMSYADMAKGSSIAGRRAVRLPLALLERIERLRRHSSASDVYRVALLDSVLIIATSSETAEDSTSLHPGHEFVFVVVPDREELIATYVRSSRTISNPHVPGA